MKFDGARREATSAILSSIRSTRLGLESRVESSRLRRVAAAAARRRGWSPPRAMHVLSRSGRISSPNMSKCFYIR